MAKKTIDIGSLSLLEQEAIKAQIEAVKKEQGNKDAASSKARVEFYYKVKGEIETALIDKLKRMPNSEGMKFLSPLYNSHMTPKGDEKWSKSKVLKQIASLPAKKPTTADGYLKAARNIEKGKPRKISQEVRDKRKLKAEEKKKKTAQKTAAKALFSKKVSDRKTKSVVKKKKAESNKSKVKPVFTKPKSAGAMAVGDDGLTKHQRYEQKRVRSAEQAERKEELRRIRRASGKTG